jgi:hypothetical protein
MRPIYAILLAVLALSVPLRADLGQPTGLTLSVKAGDKAISSDDISFTQKSGYVHLMFNAQPYPAAIAKGRAQLPAIVKALVEKEGLKAFPGAKLFKVDIADISARDDYGLPAWDKIKLLERMTVKVGKKGLQVQRVKAAP